MDRKIKKILRDIQSIKIQGATNVAQATLDGMRLGANEGRDKVVEIGKLLSQARENEPLAENAVKYVKKQMETDKKQIIIEACDAYESLIQDAKSQMIKYGSEVLENEEGILTHCHSSTASAIIINAVKKRQEKGLSTNVVSTETRPLYQGRKTAKELLDAGIDVHQIVDSAAASFITKDKAFPLGAVIVGCDELLRDGSFINKVGSFQIALAAQKDKDEFYVATTLLKLNPKKDPKTVKIEQRSEEEVWKDAPEKLDVINPAFELVDPEFVSGYITEGGVLKASEIESKSREMYPFIFE